MDMTAAKLDTDSPLWLKGYGAGFGERVVLAEIDLDLAPTGLNALMGPSGVGKSTLLRAICGIAQQSASFRCWGEMRYLGLIAGEAGWPSLVMQDAKLFVSTVYENLLSTLPDRSRLTRPEQLRRVIAHLERMNCQWLAGFFDTPVVELDLHEQRTVAVLRQTLCEPTVLCVDEPTVGMNEASAAQLMRLLKLWSESHSVLLASHHQAQVRQYADSVGLLVSGRVVDWCSADVFFSQPGSRVAKEFLQWGTCCSPSPDASPEDLDESFEPPPPLPESARTAMSAWVGPNGFVWLEKGRLAGTPRPGVVNDLETDLDALSRVGVTRLLTLLEEPLNCVEALKKRGIESVHVPINDMTAPTNVQAVEFCRQVDLWLAEGEVVAIHCHAGHGRTGTALAAWRIWRGESAATVIDGVRKIERRWIQSLEQVKFLEEYEKFLRKDHTL